MVCCNSLKRAKTAPMTDSRAHHILVVDDDHEIRTLLESALRKRGFRVSVAAHTRDARQRLADQRVDLIVLDIMMPGENGLEFIRELRASSTIPVIFVTALGEEAERVLGLELGADDYVTKPFGVTELVARIRATLRRMQLEQRSAMPSRSRILRFARWRLDPVRRELLDPEGVFIELTSAEFDLLLVLVERAGRALSRDTLLDLTRAREHEAFDRSIDVLISRLRRKLGEDARKPAIIKTVHGAGYAMVAPVEEEEIA